MRDYQMQAILAALALTVGLCGCGARETVVSPAPAVSETQESETPVVTQEIVVSAAPEKTEAVPETTPDETADEASSGILTPPEGTLTYGGTQVTLAGTLSSWHTASRDMDAELVHPLLWEDVVAVTPENTTGGLLSFEEAAPDSVTIQWWPTDSDDAVDLARAYDYTALESLEQQADIDGEGWFSIPAEGRCRVALTVTWDQSDDRDWCGTALYCFDLIPQS
jgi:hypothetical protein